MKRPGIEIPGLVVSSDRMRHLLRRLETALFEERLDDRVAAAECAEHGPEPHRPDAREDHVSEALHVRGEEDAVAPNGPCEFSPLRR